MIIYMIAKKIPIEHILASNRTSNGARAGGSSSQAEGNVNLDENASKGRDACNC